MDLIVISSPDAIKNEAFIINHLFEAGLKRFHLRKPGWDSKQLTALLTLIDKAYWHNIALHQQHHIAPDFEINRLHYTEKHRMDTSLEELANQSNAGKILSTSVHHVAVLNALKCFEYAFFGPVFKSISKPGYQSKLPGDFRIDKNGIKPKVIALGGINKFNLNKVREMNFDGAAVLGAVWNSPDNAIAAFKDLMQSLDTN